jgi:TonB-linked SusC/RagA family outer membrane protein
MRALQVLIILLTTNSYILFSQELERYSVNVENQSIKSILKEISQVTGYKFAYSDSEINSERLSSFVVKDITIAQLVELLSRKFNVQSEIAGSSIVLKPKLIKEFFLVKGAIFDSKHQSIPGVNIVNRDNSQGTVTDSLGNFTLNVSSSQNSLRLSSIGFRTEMLEINCDTTINIALQEDITTLKELVIVAFGKEDRDFVTGSVSVINPTTYSQVNQESVNSSLQTTSTGVLLQNNAGTPGSSNNIFIRGVGSITAGNSPLYVVDGIPVITGNYSQLDFSGQTINALSDLCVNDIESISILKDAAASSLYGASSSNGVVLINTKRGQKEQSQIQFDTYYGLQETTGTLSLLNAKQWMNLVNEEAVAGGKPVVYTNEQIQNSKSTDWLKEVFRTAPTYSLYLSLKGGNEKSKYYISGNYFKQEGIIIGSDYDRYSFRVNYDYAISKKLFIECGNSFSFSSNNRIEGDQTLNGPLPNAITMPPIYPVYNLDGNFNNDGPYANPVSIAKEEKNLANTYRNLFNFSINYKIFEGFVLENQFGADYYNLGEQTFAPKGTRQGAKYNGLGIEATNMAISLYNSTYFTYNYLIEKHKFSIMGGASISRYRNHGTYLRAQNFPGNSFEFLYDAATPIAAYSDELDAISNSMFTQLKYDFAQKYLVTFNMRRDGSSKFGENNRYGYFPSIAGLWYISKEPFFNRNSVVTKLKLSASYGKTGNDQIPDFSSLNLFAAGSNYNGEAGISPYQLPNPNLKWESTNQFNLGVNLELFDRLRLNVEYYYKKTKDLLFDKPLPTSWGYRYIISNIGMLENQGIETEISANLFKGPLSWNVSFSLSANQNKVLKLYKDQPIRNIGRAMSSIEVGQPISYFYGFKALGVNPDDGLLIYKDLNGDGKITDVDKTKLGSPYPLFFGGLSSSISYKSFSVNFLIYYSYGNDIYNSTRMYTETVSKGNQTTAILERWRNPGDITSIPKASSYNERISSRFLEDGSFVRLKSLKISYDINTKFIKNSPFTLFQVYIAGKNLVTFTKYSGMDPEVNYNGSNSIVLGTDFFTCPQPKSIVIGLCAKF